MGFSVNGELEKLALDSLGEAGLGFIKSQLGVALTKASFIAVTDRADIKNLSEGDVSEIVNLKKLNSCRRISKLFNEINRKVPVGGLFVGFAETYEGRMARIFKKYPKGLKRVVYLLDYLWHRVCPKLPITQSFYFGVTRGRDRAFSRTEILGRLCRAGFEIVEEKFIDGLLFFSVKKVRDPICDGKPTYGPLIALKRLGENGKKIKIYKLRTMYPFAEYLQEYVYKLNSLAEGGKFDNDFRLSPLGRLVRKIWLDEVPMLTINVLIKRDVKLAGVRPISDHYLSLYTEELRKKRLKNKPGFFPPAYADFPKTLGELMASEMAYFEAYEKAPFKTDWKLLWRALHTVFISDYKGP